MVQIIREDSRASGANYVVPKVMFKESREKSHRGPMAPQKAPQRKMAMGPTGTLP